jgi:hypothetical protein
MTGCWHHPMPAALCLARIVVQQSQLPDVLVEAEVEHYLAMIRQPSAARQTIEQLAG